MSTLRLVPADHNSDTEQPTTGHWAPGTEHSDLSDRRSHRRFNVTRRGKVFRPAGQQYVPAISRDLSFGGALLEIESERGFQIGEVIDVGLALSRKSVLPSASMLRGIVVRAEAIGEQRQLVGVRYLHREAMSAAA